ncbi:hypothetical protein HDU76_003671 [Blyttiomyces sp. JEL0837]|nr:hypothetical protein HDU76_003671 [Blyttiomyces sp. JEL0837]
MTRSIKSPISPSETNSIKSPSVESLNPPLSSPQVQPSSVSIASESIVSKQENQPQLTNEPVANDAEPEYPAYVPSDTEIESALASTGTATLARTLSARQRNLREAALAKSSQSFLRSRSNSGNNSNTTPTLVRSLSRSGSMSESVTLIRTRSQRSRQNSGNATPEPTTNADSENNEGNTATERTSSPTEEKPSDDTVTIDDDNATTASSTLPRTSSNPFQTLARTTTNAGSTLFRTLKKGTLSRSNSSDDTQSEAPSISDEEKLLKRKLADADRALGWGMWKKGFEIYEALANGIDTPNNEPEPRAVKFLDPAVSEFKNPTGCYWLGKHFVEERGDFGTGLAWFAIAADGGYPVAMNTFAQALANGDGTDGSKPNIGLAMRWFYKAYHAQNPTPAVLMEAAEGIGRLYLTGPVSNNNNNQEEEIPWLALTDIEASQHTVIPQNLPLATQWLRRAASKGSKTALELLAQPSDIRVHNIYAQAIEDLKLRKWRKGVEAMFGLADGGFADAVVAVDPLQSSLVGFPNGIHDKKSISIEVTGHLGTFISARASKERQSKDMDIDYVHILDQQASGWFWKGVEFGDFNSMVRLAAWAVEGHTAVSSNAVPLPGMAMVLYCMAWDKSKNAQAAEGIGMLCERGGVVPLSKQTEATNNAVNEADKVYITPSNYTNFIENVQGLTSINYQVPRDPGTAKQYYSKAAFKGSIRAEAALGYLLLYGGKGGSPEIADLKPDVEQGMYHLARAAKAGKYGTALVDGYGTGKKDKEVGEGWIAKAEEAERKRKEMGASADGEGEDGVERESEEVKDEEGDDEASKAELDEEEERRRKRATVLMPLGAPETFDIPEGKAGCCLVM